MSLSLQKTKLYLPPARDQWVDRPRLMARLDGLRADGSRLALVCAPAGSGKTTVVCQWLRRQDWPVGWVSLDARDNLPARFFAYLIEALQTACPGAGKQSRELLDLPGVSLEEVVTCLVNDLAEAPCPFILALDDFHAITNPLLHRAVEALVDAQPPDMRLLILSREDPAIRLGGRRARGELVELRQEDLRFTQAETVAFLNHGMGLQLSADQMERLEMRTEGWITGLQLAGLSLRGALDADRFIEDFSGSHRFILDYLVEEALSGQPAPLYQFMLETAILDRLCAGLCAAVTEISLAEARGRLDQLVKGNLFLIPLDEERRWFRYHHLFSDLLLVRLQSTCPEAHIQALHRRAAEWYEANHDPRLAVEHAIKAQDWELAADLISRHILSRWQTVDLDFFLLLNHLPEQVITGRPSLCLQGAWVCVISGQDERVAGLVEAAERVLQAPGRPPQPSDAADRAFARALHAYLADLQNQPVELDQSLDQALAVIPEDNVGMRNSVEVLLGTIFFMEGEFERALRLYSGVVERDRRTGGTSGIPIATMRSVWVMQAQGNLTRASRLLKRSQEFTRAHGPRRFYVSGGLNLTLGELLLEWDRLDEAEEQICEGLRLMQDWSMSPVLVSAAGLSARMRLARGDLEGAAQDLEWADDLMRRRSTYPRFVDAVEQARVRYWIQAGDQQALDNWAVENAPLAATGPIRFRYEARLIELARAWLVVGQRDAALALLERLVVAAAGRRGSRVAALALLAAAHGDGSAQGAAAIDEALRLAQPEGYLRTFADAGAGRAVRAWLESGGGENGTALRAYARRVLAVCRDQPNPGVGEWVEPLSARELEVLPLIAQGWTNQQIAASLVISVRTVKKHVENITGKLGAQNRTQAVARARELGLLES